MAAAIRTAIFEAEVGPGMPNLGGPSGWWELYVAANRSNWGVSVARSARLYMATTAMSGGGVKPRTDFDMRSESWPEE